MTHEDQVLDLFGQANPVPDPDAFQAPVEGPVHLATLEHRSERMQEAKTRTTEPTKPPRPNLWVPAAAAAVIIAVIGIATFTFAGNSGRDTASTPTDTGATPTSTAAPVLGAAEIAAIESAYGARTDGDIETWIGSLGGDELAASIEWRLQLEADIAAGQQFSFLEPCTYEGVEGGNVTLINCRIRMSDAVTGPSGIYQEGLSTFHIDRDLRIVGWDDNLTSNDPGDFVQGLVSWMQEVHPDEASQLTITDPTDWFMRTPADVAIVLQFVDEFVAQSDEYPLTSP